MTGHEPGLKSHLDTLDTAGANLETTTAEREALIAQAEIGIESARHDRDIAYTAALSALLDLRTAGKITDRNALAAVLRLRQHKPRGVIGSEEFSMKKLLDRFDRLHLGEPVIIGNSRITGTRWSWARDIRGGVIAEQPELEVYEDADEAMATIRLALYHGAAGERKQEDIRIPYSGLGRMVVGSAEIQDFLDSRRYAGTGPGDRYTGRSYLAGVGKLVHRIQATQASGAADWDYSNVEHLVAILTPISDRPTREQATALHAVEDIEQANRSRKHAASLQALFPRSIRNPV